MNDLSTRLAQLGEILSGELQQRLSDWSQPGGVFDAPLAGLTPLVQAGEDLDRWQAEMSVWTQLEAQFSGGFIPSNLLNAAEADAPETGDPEGLPEDRLPGRGAASHRDGNVSRSTGTLPGHPAGYDPLGPERISALEKNAPWATGQHASAQTPPAPETPVAPYFQSAAGFLEHPLLDKTTRDTMLPGQTPPAPEQPNQPRDVENTPDLSRTPRSFAGIAGEPGTARQEPPASIWSQPLQGLGDFMTNYVPPPARWTPPETPEQPKTHSVFVPPPFPQEQTPPTPTPVSGAIPRNGGSVAIPDDPLVSSSGIAMHTGLLPENQAFQSIEPTESTPMTTPDTDELLDELTQRIIRDFRRFYP